MGNAIIDDTPAHEASAEASDAPVADGGDEFADLKKKKKKSGTKKAAFDLEAFEKEIADGTAEGDDGADGEGLDDEPVEGEDPFKGEGDDEGEGVSKAIAAAEAKAWLKEGDRDYHYTEVRSSSARCPDDFG